MIHLADEHDPDAPVIIIDVGNTVIDVATWQREQVTTPLSAPTNDEGAFATSLAAHIDAMPKRHVVAVVVGSVVPAALERIRVHVRELLTQEALVVGDTIPLPMDVGVTDVKAIGVDRVCAAAAAYDKLQTGCVIIDFGTAVTVDLVDDEGTLLGGAILPGLRMQLQALHEHAAALPAVEPVAPELPYGRNTAEAMQTGVCRGLAGAVRGLVEAYAGHINHWPQVVATGGDLTLLTRFCDFVDTRVPHLALRGVGIAYIKHLEAMGA
jgi:type III pantothenate kinase